MGGVAGQRRVAVEQTPGCGVDGAVDDVIERFAQGRGLIGLDRVEDLQLVVFIRPLELLRDSGGALDSEPFAFLGDDGLLVAALLRALGHDLGACLAIEHVVLVVKESKPVRRTQCGDGAGVMRLAHDGEADVGG